VEEGAKNTQDFAAAIAGGAANSGIKAPGSLSHRYYREDFGHGLLPFLALAAIASVPAPTAEALLSLAQTLTGTRYRESGRTAEAMGIAGLDRKAMMTRVQG
jgi:opine dehydrogenase